VSWVSRCTSTQLAPGPTLQGGSGGKSLATCGRFNRLGSWTSRTRSKRLNTCANCSVKILFVNKLRYQKQNQDFYFCWEKIKSKLNSNKFCWQRLRKWHNVEVIWVSLFFECTVLCFHKSLFKCRCRFLEWRIISNPNIFATVSLVYSELPVCVFYC